MNQKAWQDLGKVEFAALAKARWQALNVVQWAARTANSFMAAGSRDDRLSMSWNNVDAGMMTRTFGDLALEFRIPTLALQFVRGGKKVPHVMDPEEHSPAEIEAWLLVEFLHHGIDRGRFSKALPYEIADLMSGDADDYTPEQFTAELQELAGWFRNAAGIFETVGHAHGMKSGTALQCWPQDLSMTCRLPIKNVGASAPLTELGFVPGTQEDAEPSFYVAGVASDGERTEVAALDAPMILAAADPVELVTTFLADGMTSVRSRATS